MSQLWYEQLSDMDRQALFTEMRRQDKRKQYYRGEAQKLSPPFGMVACGGGSFEQTLKAEIIASYLRALRNGGTPQFALDCASKDRTKYVAAWNKSRGGDYVVHRCPQAEQALLEDLHRSIVNAVKSPIGGTCG
jgi:hypothetical protein